MEINEFNAHLHALRRHYTGELLLLDYNGRPRPPHWGLGLLRDEAESEWDAIGKRLDESEDDEDAACARHEQEMAAWRLRYGYLYPEMYGPNGRFEIMRAQRRLAALGIKPPSPPHRDFGGNVIPQRQLSRRNGNPYRKSQ
jgi:hypothetical protein